MSSGRNIMCKRTLPSLLVEFTYNETIWNETLNEKYTKKCTKNIWQQLVIPNSFESNYA